MSKKNKVPQALKEAIKNDWIKPLPVVAEIDCSDNEIKEVLINTLQLIREYPGIEQLKRKVLKKNDPNYYVVEAEKLLQQCLSGEANGMAFHEINEVLYKALAKLVLS
jgi:hypothetical protein